MNETERRTRHEKAMWLIEAESRRRRAEALAVLIPEGGGQDDR